MLTEPTEDQVEQLKRTYTPGMKIRIKEMRNERFPVPFGSIGTVTGVDDSGYILMNWTHSSLKIIPWVDDFEVAYETEEEKKAAEEESHARIAAWRAYRGQYGDVLYCSRCLKSPEPFIEHAKVQYPISAYCPNCGAHMEGNIQWDTKSPKVFFKELVHRFGLKKAIALVERACSTSDPDDEAETHYRRGLAQEADSYIKSMSFGR